MTATFEHPATSKVGQVAVIRGDGGVLVRMLSVVPDPTPATDPRTSVGEDAPPMSTSTTQDHPPLDDNLTVAEIAHHYGLTAGPVHTAHSKGLIGKRGTDGKRHYRYDHRELLTAIEQGFIGQPRGGTDRPAEAIAVWRERIAAAVTTLQGERRAGELAALATSGKVRSYTTREVAEVWQCTPGSVFKLADVRGITALRPGVRGNTQNPALWPADEVDAAEPSRMAGRTPALADPPPCCSRTTRAAGGPDPDDQHRHAHGAGDPARHGVDAAYRAGWCAAAPARPRHRHAHQ